MKKMMIFVGLLLWQTAFAKGPALVEWDTSESYQRIERSHYKKDFFRLANHFRSQPDGITCGPTTGAIVLNALRVGRKEIANQTAFDENLKEHLPKTFDPRYHYFTPQNFFDHRAKNLKTRAQIYGEPIKGKPDYGFQLRQFYKHLRNAFGLKVELRIVDDKLSEKQIRRELLENLKTANDYVIVNYARKALGQKGGGHISPLGAYDKATDSFLIMDVTAAQHNWVWVKASDLISAMKTFDTVENRGYLLVKEGL